MSEESESRRLDGIAAQSKYASGVNTPAIHYSFSIFERFARAGSILEMGPAEGVMTDRLASLGQPLTLVEGAADFCNDLRVRYPNVTVVHSLFETYSPLEKSFDNILLGNVLEHVEHPVALLKRASAWLSDKGRIFACVPNAQSLHRQAGVLLGKLAFEEDLNELDLHHGHRRIYNPATFRRDFNQACLRIETSGGFWLKPLSNAQIEAQWPEDLLHSFFVIGERHPDIAASIYIVASRHP
ncbi:class I SAM-dependent methyltransferase [Lichenifustis flavocetrariae]|uniref:Class I SAM-dependent methyltransferase n=1 Tax=Lichenifustis flavocetrariae TaxID=2949735 RepID=A0AA42CL52_9HYPH|nr:methyltransferase domain-containing protein [Lichenifustis flavocetrariae]MCW6510006.1 class I SAM-dependent methyltransferase [Lichenifustis flavocetrariae]